MKHKVLKTFLKCNKVKTLLKKLPLHRVTKGTWCLELSGPAQEGNSKAGAPPQTTLTKLSSNNWGIQRMSSPEDLKRPSRTS